MNIIVSIKQVPETTEVRINPETNTLMREGVKSIINPFDMYALEEGIRLREKVGGKVTVITMAPPQGVAALREAIAMGADEAILLSDRAFAGSDTWATSYTLAKAIEKIGDYDLIICGKQAIDGDTAQVGPGIAETLNIPFVTYVRKIDEINTDNLVLERLMEEGSEKIQLPLPALITVVKEINEPRLPSLRGMMKAKKVDVPSWGINDLEVNLEKIGLKGSPTQVNRIFTPEVKGKGEMLSGEPGEIATALFERLRGAGVI